MPENAVRPSRLRDGRRMLRNPFRYTLPGAWVALVVACLSFTPSLLPRSAVFQGAVTGINMAIGYGIGVLAAWAWRVLADRPARSAGQRSVRVFTVVAAVSSVTAIVLGERWQRQIRDLMGVDAPAVWTIVLTPLVAAVLFVLLVQIARFVRLIHRCVAALLARLTSERGARFIGAAALVITAVTLGSGVLVDSVMGAVDRAFAVSDLTTPGRVTQPTNTLRSGSASSLIEWDTLGRQGRVFTGRGPTAADISDFSGDPAKDPIRIFAGWSSAGSTEDRAALAVRDLERAGGFDRAYLLVTTTTGSGWVEPSSADSFEYITSGDSAIVAMQYSHLPSWISYLVDQDEARNAGRELFDAVYARWSTLPPDDRPKLMVFGESLGSFGAETAFSGEFDLANRTDGALLVGPPNFNTLYRRFVDHRDAGSREIEPIVSKGRTVRFSTVPGLRILPEDEPWLGTRVLYLQHASDPIVWWNTDLLFQRPDWLEERRGDDVLGAMRWIPLVTFWQVTADLPLGTEVPAGFGHLYRGEHVDGWVAVVQPPSWTADRTTRLRQIVGRDR